MWKLVLANSNLKAHRPRICHSYNQRLNCFTHKLHLPVQCIHCYPCNEGSCSVGSSVHGCMQIFFYICTHKFPKHKSNLLVLACAFTFQYAEQNYFCRLLCKYRIRYRFRARNVSVGPYIPVFCLFFFFFSFSKWVN